MGRHAQPRDLVVTHRRGRFGRLEDLGHACGQPCGQPVSGRGKPRDNL
jgi:hypothetical protein